MEDKKREWIECGECGRPKHKDRECACEKGGNQ